VTPSPGWPPSSWIGIHSFHPTVAGWPTLQTNRGLRDLRPSLSCRWWSLAGIGWWRAFSTLVGRWFRALLPHQRRVDGGGHRCGGRFLPGRQSGDAFRGVLQRGNVRHRFQLVRRIGADPPDHKLGKKKKGTAHLFSGVEIDELSPFLFLAYLPWFLRILSHLVPIFLKMLSTCLTCFSGLALMVTVPVPRHTIFFSDGS